MSRLSAGPWDQESASADIAVSRRRLLAGGVLLAITGGAAGCAADDRPKPIMDPAPTASSDGRVIVGSADFTESIILANLYSQALVANDVDASTYLDIGPRPSYLEAIRSNAISIVPEYTGNLLAFVDPESTAKTKAGVEEALPGALGTDLALLDVSRAENADVFVVTRATAERYGIGSLADLAELAQPIPAGGPPEIAGRTYGPAGLQSTYDVRVIFDGYVDISAKAADLRSGKISVAAFSTTDAILGTQDFVKLADPKSLILPQFQVPLVRRDVAARQDVVDPLNALSAALTTEDLADLNASVTDGRKRPEDVARKWLRSKRLLAG